MVAALDPEEASLQASLNFRFAPNCEPCEPLKRLNDSCKFQAGMSGVTFL